MNCHHLHHAFTLDHGWRCADCGKSLVIKRRFREIADSGQPPLGRVSTATRQQRKHTVYTESQAHDLCDADRRKQQQIVADAGSKVPLRDVYYEDVVAAPVGEDIR